jgi:PRTRC genetic system protein A
MFNIFVNDGTQELPNDDILYIVCKEGIYLKKNLGIMESITPVEKISTLEPVETMARMHIKPIPAYQFAQVERFFREVYEQYHSEAIVLLFYNEERKIYKIVPPYQKVNGGSVDYKRTVIVEGFIMVGDIHSHASMSAFHSPTDDKDEDSFDGLHITIGNCNSEYVSISASIVSNGKRFMVTPSKYINKLTLTRDIDEEYEKPYATVQIWDKDLKKLVPKPGAAQKTYTVRRFDKRYMVDISSKYRKFDPTWMDQVEHKPYSYVSYYGQEYWKNWRKNMQGYPRGRYDSDAWKDYKPGTVITPSILATQAKKPITFPEHTQSADGAVEKVVDKKDFNPCLDCAFKHHKIDWVMDQIMDEDEDVDETEYYQCTKCGILVEAEDDDPICPKCKLTDHLILLDTNEEEDRGLDWYRCDKCNIVFDTTDPHPQCPQCKVDDHLVQLQYGMNSDDGPSEYKYKCPHCASEMNDLNEGNECPFCRQRIDGPADKDETSAKALEAAMQADEMLERLPIPDQDYTPINKPRNPNRGIFKKLFGGGK